MACTTRKKSADVITYARIAEFAGDRIRVCRGKHGVFGGHPTGQRKMTVRIERIVGTSSVSGRRPTRKLQFLDELMARWQGFPDHCFFTFGGDSERQYWDANPKIQAFMNAHGAEQVSTAVFQRARAEAGDQASGKPCCLDDVLVREFGPRIYRDHRGAGSFAGASGQTGLNRGGILSNGYT